MFKNLPFAYKIGLLPVLSAFAFFLILVTSWIMGDQTARQVDSIENGYYSSLELNRELSETLEQIQRSFQDAAASADLDLLADADALRKQFVRALQAGLDNPVVDVTPLGTIANAFNRYYLLGSNTTRKFVEGNLDDEIFSTLQDITAQAAELQRMLDILTTRDKASITQAFANAQRSQRNAGQILVAVTAIAVAVMIVLSLLIIRMTSQSVRTTVRGMDALVNGDLTENSVTQSSDEMGKMVTHVGEVRQTINELAGEISALIQAVRAGKLKVRGNPANFRGAYADLIRNINELIDEFVAPIEVTGQYVERIARGDIPPPLTDAYQGDFNHIKCNLNRLVTVMNGLINQTAGLTSAAKAGELATRGNDEDFSGVWRDLIVGINETLDGVTEPMQAVSDVMSAMARGDLTTKINGNYRGTFAEMQNDTNMTIDRLTDVIGSIMQASDAVWMASKEINEGNQSLRLRTADQAKSLQHTTSNMEHMTDIVRQNARNAQCASETVLAAREKAQKGGAVVGDAMRAMDEINGSSKKISEIISVINEIAFQTNLLALNASVEAARAGDHGRGFAVVASEVRSLAGRSATAAKEINALIQDSVGKVEEGSRLVNASGQTLDEIVSAVADVSAIVGEIAAASSEQAASIESVNKAVAQMEQITNQNSALVSEATRSSETMGAEARKLKETTEFFTVDAGAAALEPYVKVSAAG
ncbi:MAG: methyl-accepting chemotaxis protein [Woeseia sp.]